MHYLWWFLHCTSTDILEIIKQIFKIHARQSSEFYSRSLVCLTSRGGLSRCLKRKTDLANPGARKLLLKLIFKIQITTTEAHNFSII